MKKFYRKVLLLLSIGTLLNAESTVYDRIFDKAFYENDVKKMKMAISKGADVNMLEYYNIWRRPIGTLKLLIDNNYNLNDQSKGCILSKFFKKRKVSNDFYKSIKLLLDNGANPDCHDKYNVPVVLKEATNRDGKENEFIKTYQLLINNMSKSSINEYIIKTWGGELDYKFKALKLATWDKQKFKILIKAGTKINEPTYYDKYGEPSYTPLELAIKTDNIELIKLVLKMGANINLVYKSMSPIDYAHQQGKDNAELYLIEHGAKYISYYQLEPINNSNIKK